MKWITVILADSNIGLASINEDMFLGELSL